MSDVELLGSIRLDAILGLSCVVLFGLLNASFKMYRIRLVNRSPFLFLKSWNVVDSPCNREATFSSEMEHSHDLVEPYFSFFVVYFTKDVDLESYHRHR